MIRRAQRLIPWAAALLLAASVGACKKDEGGAAGENPEGSATATDSGEPIVIAVAGPMTGQYASFGQQMAAGAKQAVADLNAKGGVLGRQLQLEVGDDACDPKQAVAVANQMVQQGAVFVAGHWCSGSSIPANQVYDEEGIVSISPGSTSPKLTEEGGEMVFRVCGRDDQQGEVAAKFLMEQFPGKNIAVLHDKTAYGKGLADETRKNLQAGGLEPTLYEAYTAGEKDYTALVSKLKQNEIDVVYIGGYHTEAGLILRQMREQGMESVLMSGDALVTQEYWSITGDAGAGTLMTFSPDPRKNENAAAVVEVFREQKIEPEGYVLYTYGAIQAWAAAAEAAGKVDADAVVEKLHAMEFETVLGSIGFDDKGDVTAPGYVVYEWKDGAYAYYGEEGGAQAEGGEGGEGENENENGEPPSE
ncbi:branched-chain amino acid ABC transporter substrate-binding protein [Haliangium ochraceum]|uniref:Extracellular ligand-binding receptor n=1 Tax=Haliangium ochraceum (strain DSM 14365 / JCM 11303 / SMP-2) TaxID=502025 RepID=D0LYK9_HALO1|nr:branched-chain amino acid ABC transporter substrate-binding protein [Haliangium ochraceum]ACY17875.1 Extracellular ligand-binding receptor [Haliangium ochraceum DSM 14365]